MNTEKAYSSEELGYVAGMIDGEGSIWMAKKKGTEYYTPLLSIGNNNLQSLERCRKIIGGTLNRSKVRPKQWVLVTTANRMRVSSPLLIPLLTVKKERALLLSRFLELHSLSSPRMTNRSLADRAEANAIIARIKELNSNG